MEHIRAAIGAELAAAESLLEVGRAADARQRVAKVVAAEPENADALCLLARCCIELDEPENALDAATAAVEHAPNRPDAHILRASALLPLDRSEEALVAANVAVSLDGDRAAAHLVRALALFNTYRQREAWAALHETTRLAPEWAEAHVIQGTMHHTFGRLRKARLAYQRALARQPEHAGALEGLAQLSLRRGKTGAALQQFGAAAALAPTGQSAAAGVDRALTNLCGLALLTAWLAASPLAIAGRYWVAWPISVAVMLPYLVWFRYFRRRVPAHLWAAVRARLMSDPRLRVRLVMAGVTLATGVLVGVVAAIFDLDIALAGIVGTVGWLLLIAAIVFAVDVKYTRKRIADGGDVLAGLSPDEQANVQVGRLALRWFRMTALLAVIPAVQAAEPADELVARATTGTAVIALLLAYYRWTRRRWQRKPGRPLGASLAHLIPIFYVLLGLLWLVIPVAAYWPGQPPTLATVGGVVIGALTIAFLIVWLPVQGVRRVVRYLTSP